MLKVSHSTLIFLSGLIWLVVGCVLLPLGLNLIVSSLLKENAALPQPILHFLAPYVGGLDQAALTWIVIALFIGFIKGRRVFAKSVQHSVKRILALPNPTHLSHLYPPSYYILLGAMVLLGIILRFTTQDIRGGIDVAVGSALINGAMLYFRQAYLVHRQTSTT